MSLLRTLTTAGALVASLLLLAPAGADARLVFTPMLQLARDYAPTPSNQAARHARELVHRNEWATLSTSSVQFRGVPFGNIVSYSDGIGRAPENSTGELFFYLTELDATAQDLAADARASVTISMAQQGEHACKKDVEDPTCWKLTLVGSVAPVTADRRKFALDALFSRHPEMATWPHDHGFHAYALHVERLVLLDFYGGAKHVTPDEYYHVKLQDE